jgi:hypothetical protein
MLKYPKIQSVYMRDRNNKNRLIEGQFSTKEILYLANNTWIWTEKIDGTNIRVHFDFDGNDVFLGGREENAQIHASLCNFLFQNITPDLFLTSFDPNEVTSVTLYGEGYGVGIGPGGNYAEKGTYGFALFDVLVTTQYNTIFLARRDVEDVARKMYLEVVPYIESGTISEAIDFVKAGFTSRLNQHAITNQSPAEGLVLKPSIDMYSRLGERIMTKIKTEDFKQLQ